MSFNDVRSASSIDQNPTVANIDIDAKTTYWLWAVFAIMLVSDLVFLFLSFRRPVGTRLFHQLPILILTTAAIAYYSMASDLGATAVRTEFTRGAAYGTTRSIWYARYIDWTITTPLLLLELLLNTGLPLSDILTVIFMDLVMIITGLIGALVATRYKWGYFAFGCAAFLYIWFILLTKGRSSALSLGNDVRKAYFGSALFLGVIWTLYPIAWGIADGGNNISPRSEMIFYGILDIIAKPVFCFYHIWALRGIPYERFMLSSGKASVGYAAAGGVNGGMTDKGRMSSASNAPLNAAGTHTGAAGLVPGTNNGLGGHSAGTGGTTGTAADETTTAGGPLNGRHGITHRNSNRAVAEEGRM